MTTPSNATVVSMSLRASARCRCVPQPGARSHSGSGRTHHLQEALILRPLEDMTGDDLSASSGLEGAMVHAVLPFGAAPGVLASMHLSRSTVSNPFSSRFARVSRTSKEHLRGICT